VPVAIRSFDLAVMASSVRPPGGALADTSGDLGFASVRCRT